MTTETTCLSSVWQTDEETRSWLALHGREQDYRPLHPQPMARTTVVSMSILAPLPMIALVFPSQQRL